MRGAATATVTLLLATPVAAATPGPSVHTSRGCYLVSQSVRFSGSGFAPRRPYDVTIDGVDFGGAQTDGGGSLSASVVPGGLPAGVPQGVDRLEVSDGSRDGSATFTLTRSAGARFLASRGDPRTLRAPFQVWGFALDGSSRYVYLHYIAPAGQPRKTVRLGRTTGQCGYLITPRMRFFPFSPSTGKWTLQADTAPRYTSRPVGPAARIYVQIARG